VKVLALDYGSARTGVAVSDATGTLARPLPVVERAATPAGLARLAELVADQDVERVVVGLPLTLRGEAGAQAQETARFVEALRAAVGVPVESFDERFTTALAARSPAGRAAEDARAAAHLLEGYLAWSTARRSRRCRRRPSRRPSGAAGRADPACGCAASSRSCSSSASSASRSGSA
jgi:putative Holliday junction resolvase